MPYIYAAVKWGSTGSGSDLAPGRCYAITWTNADSLSIGHLGTKQYANIFIHETVLKIVVCIKAAILFNGGYRVTQ